MHASAVVIRLFTQLKTCGDLCLRQRLNTVFDARCKPFKAILSANTGWKNLAYLLRHR